MNERTPAWGRVGSVAWSAGLGVVFSGAWMAPGLSVTTWCAVIGLMVQVRRSSRRAAVGHAGVFLLSACAVGFSWVPATLIRFSNFNAAVSWSLHALFCVIVSAQLALWAGLACGPARQPAMVAALWVALEFLYPDVFPWRAGHLALDWPFLPQLADLTGVYGISFMVVWAAAEVAAVLARARRGRDVMPLAVVLVVVGAYGAWQAAAWRDARTAAPHIDVAVVQPGATPSGASAPQHRRAILRQRTLQLDRPVDVVFWPESAMSSYPHGLQAFDSTALRAAGLHEGVRPLEDPPAPILFGGATHPPDRAAPHHNSAFLIDRDERLLGRYHKRVLVPFGEYVPGEQWFPALHGLSRFKTVYVGGTSSAPLEIPGVARLGVLICYEDLLTGLARDSVRAGADVLVNVTNDEWFGDSVALAQHAQLARARSIETRRYLIRATMTGRTVVFDPVGAVVGQLPTQDAGTLVVAVHPRTGLTPYVRWGDLFAWACTAAALCGLWRRRTYSASAAEPSRAAG